MLSNAMSHFDNQNKWTSCETGNNDVRSGKRPEDRILMDVFIHDFSALGVSALDGWTTYYQVDKLLGPMFSLAYINYIPSVVQSLNT